MYHKCVPRPQSITTQFFSLMLVVGWLHSLQSIVPASVVSVLALRQIHNDRYGAIEYTSWYQEANMD